MNVRHLVDFNGVLVSSFVPRAAVALILLLLLRPLLARVGFQRLVWNPPLAEAALLVCIFGALSLIF